MIFDYESTQYISSFPLGKKKIEQMNVVEKTIGQTFVYLPFTQAVNFCLFGEWNDVRVENKCNQCQLCQGNTPYQLGQGNTPYQLYAKGTLHTSYAKGTLHTS